MAITVQCRQCTKRYKLDDRFAGKRVKCKSCGAVLDVLQPGGPAPVPAAVGELPLAELPPLPPPPPPAHQQADDPKPGGIVLPTGPARPRPDGERDALQTAPKIAEPPTDRLRPDFPYIDLVATLLPWVLLVAGLAIYIAVAVRRANASPDASITHLRSVVLLVLYGLLMAPLSALAIRLADRMASLKLPAWIIAPVFAAFVVPFALANLFLDISGVPGMAFGFVLGLAVVFPALWIRFRLQLGDAALSTVFGGAAFAAGGILAWLVLLMLPTAAPQPVDRLAGANVSKPPARTPTTRPAPKLKIDPTTEPAWVDAPPATLPAPPTPLAVRPLPPRPPARAVRPPPPPRPGSAVPRLPVQPQPLKPPPKPPEDPLPQVDSSYVTSIVSPPELSGYDQLLLPELPVNFLGLQRRSGNEDDLVETWSVQPLKRIGQVTFRRDANSRSRYVISLDGELVVRIVTWPNLAAEVWSVKDVNIARAIPLNEKYGTPELYGFLTPTNCVVQWNKGGESGVEIWDVKTGKRVRSTLLATSVKLIDDATLSADGLMLAFPTPAPRGSNVARLVVQEFSSTNQPLRRLPMTGLDRRWSHRPTGMGFSRQGGHVAALFEQAGHAQILCWRLFDGKLIYTHNYVGGVMADASDAPKPARLGPAARTRSFDWMPDGGSWLIQGSVFDFKTGNYVARLWPTDIKTQRILDADTCLIVSESGKTGRVCIVKLNPAKLHEAAEEARKKPAKPSGPPDAADEADDPNLPYRP